MLAAKLYSSPDFRFGFVGSVAEKLERSQVRFDLPRFLLQHLHGLGLPGFDGLKQLLAARVGRDEAGEDEEEAAESLEAGSRFLGALVRIPAEGGGELHWHRRVHHSKAEALDLDKQAKLFGNPKS